jgi:hypothetical protein
VAAYSSTWARGSSANFACDSLKEWKQQRKSRLLNKNPGRTQFQFWLQHKNIGIKMWDVWLYTMYNRKHLKVISFHTFTYTGTSTFILFIISLVLDWERGVGGGDSFVDSKLNAFPETVLSVFLVGRHICYIVLVIRNSAAQNSRVVFWRIYLSFNFLPKLIILLPLSAARLSESCRNKTYAFTVYPDTTILLPDSRLVPAISRYVCMQK